MDLTDKIINNREYKTCMERIEAFEKDRVFCKHDMEHLLSVARIAYCINLERGYDISKDLIYSAALLHDIGRCRQYEEGVPHEEAGVEISQEILADCGASKEETELIIDAITSHRGMPGTVPAFHLLERRNRPQRSTLAQIIKEADNLSRACFNCRAQDDCKWTPDRKNMTPEY